MPYTAAINATRAVSRDAVDVGGGLARPEVVSADVRGSSRDRRLAVQSGAAGRRRVEPAGARSAIGRRGALSLHRQHQPRPQQARHAVRQRCVTLTSRCRFAFIHTARLRCVALRLID